MSATFPPEIAQFVEDQLKTGRFVDENSLLTAALEVFREVHQRQAAIQNRIQTSRAQVQQGDVDLLDIDAIISEMEGELDSKGQSR